MGLAEDLANVQQYVAHKGPSCTVCLLLLNMAPDDADALRAAFAGPAMTSAIGTVLRNNGHHVSDATLQRHRNGKCRGTA